MERQKHIKGIMGQKAEKLVKTIKDNPDSLKYLISFFESNDEETGTSTFFWREMTEDLKILVSWILENPEKYQDFPKLAKILIDISHDSDFFLVSMFNFFEILKEKAQSEKQKKFYLREQVYNFGDFLEGDFSGNPEQDVEKFREQLTIKNMLRALPKYLDRLARSYEKDSDFRHQELGKVLRKKADEYNKRQFKDKKKEERL